MCTDLSHGTIFNQSQQKEPNKNKTACVRIYLLYRSWIVSYFNRLLHKIVIAHIIKLYKMFNGKQYMHAQTHSHVRMQFNSIQHHLRILLIEQLKIVSHTFVHIKYILTFIVHTNSGSCIIYIYIYKRNTNRWATMSMPVDCFLTL